MAISRGRRRCASARASRPGSRPRWRENKHRMNAVLALENGTVYRGTAAGAQGIARGEVVFNTSMTGYQEVLTDPSYAGQIVTMTSPQIGNYGVAPDDVESTAPKVAGFIMREESPIASNWRASGTLRDYLVAQQRRRHRRHRHARADAAAAIVGRHARRHRHGRCRHGRAGAAGARDSEHGRHRSRARGDLRGAVRLARRHRSEPRRGAPRSGAGAADALEAAAARRRVRLRHQMEHPAAPRHLRLPGAACFRRRRPRKTCSPPMSTASS